MVQVKPVHARPSALEMRRLTHFMRSAYMVNSPRVEFEIEVNIKRCGHNSTQCQEVRCAAL